MPIKAIEYNCRRYPAGSLLRHPCFLCLGDKRFLATTRCVLSTNKIHVYLHVWCPNLVSTYITTSVIKLHRYLQVMRATPHYGSISCSCNLPTLICPHLIHDSKITVWPKVESKLAKSLHCIYLHLTKKMTSNGFVGKSNTVLASW